MGDGVNILEMENTQYELTKKVFGLIVLSILLYATFIATGSLAILSDAIYALVDALFIFGLWISLLIVYRGFYMSKTALKLTSLSIFFLSLMLIFGSSILLYAGFLALKYAYVVKNPDLVVASEIFYVLLLFYLYLSLREEALKEDVRALVGISVDVERNIMSSFLVITAGLFSMAGIYPFDAITAILISTYVLYRSLLLSYRSLRSTFGFSDPLVVEAVRERVVSAGVRLRDIYVVGVGPFYFVEVDVDTSHLPDRWEKVEDILRRRIERVLPSSAKVIIKDPGGGI